MPKKSTLNIPTFNGCLTKAILRSSECKLSFNCLVLGMLLLYEEQLRTYHFELLHDIFLKINKMIRFIKEEN